jgi:predicted outer membrane repeat protein
MSKGVISMGIALFIMLCRIATSALVTINVDPRSNFSSSSCGNSSFPCPSAAYAWRAVETQVKMYDDVQVVFAADVVHLINPRYDYISNKYYTLYTSGTLKNSKLTVTSSLVSNAILRFNQTACMTQNLRFLGMPSAINLTMSRITFESVVGNCTIFTSDDEVGWNDYSAPRVWMTYDSLIVRNSLNITGSSSLFYSGNIRLNVNVHNLTVYNVSFSAGWKYLFYYYSWTAPSMKTGDITIRNSNFYNITNCVILGTWSDNEYGSMKFYILNSNFYDFLLGDWCPLFDLESDANQIVGEVIFYNCSFDNLRLFNDSSSRASIVGMYMWTISLTMTNSYISGIYAPGTESWGGFIYANQGSAPVKLNFSNLSLKSLTFKSAGNFLCVAEGYASLSMSNCSVLNSTATGAYGGLVFAYPFRWNATFTNVRVKQFTGVVYLAEYWYSSQTASRVQFYKCDFSQISAYSTPPFLIDWSEYADDLYFLESNFSSFDPVNLVQVAYYGSQLRMSKCNFSSFYQSPISLIVASSSSFINISDCSFQNISSRSNGGILFQYPKSVATFSNSYFSSIQSDGPGAVSFADVDSTLVVSRSTFEDIESQGQGGAIFHKGNAILLEDSSFINTLSGAGGAVSFVSVGSTRIVNCSFQNSTASYGGAIYLSGVSTNNSISASTFSQNHADVKGGAILADDQVYLDITQLSSFVQNQAVIGGAIHSYSPNLKMTDSQFTGNLANQGGFVCLFVY